MSKYGEMFVKKHLFCTEVDFFALLLLPQPTLIKRTPRFFHRGILITPGRPTPIPPVEQLQIVERRVVEDRMNAYERDDGHDLEA